MSDLFDKTRFDGVWNLILYLAIVFTGGSSLFTLKKLCTYKSGL